MRPSTRVVLGLVAPVLLLTCYAAWASSAGNPYFPPLGVVLGRFEELWLFARISTDVVPSLRNLGLGLATALLLGIPTGVLLGRVRWAGEMFTPLLDFGRSVPPLMLVPPLVLVLGVDDLGKVVIIALGAFFPVCVSTVDGMKQADPTLLDAARAVGLGRWRTVTSIYVPSGSPAIFGGIQVAIQVAFVLMVASEMLAAFRGIGYVTIQAQVSFDSVTMWAGTLLLALLGFAANGVFIVVRNRVLSWHTGMRVTRATK